MKFLKSLRRQLIKIFLVVFFFWDKELQKKLRWTLNAMSISCLLKLVFQYYTKHPKEFKYNLSLCICVKDESKYIQEWIEYYLIQGVDHFYIYNNNGTDNTQEVIQKYIDKGIVSWITYPGPDKQIEIYNHAVQNFKWETRWLGFVDIDEFIVPLKHSTLAEAMKDYEDCSQLRIHWVLYGSSGHREETKGLVIERFTQHQEGVNKFTKSILNPRACLYANVHAGLVLGKSVDEYKRVYEEDKTPITTDILRVNHYVIKSWEEYSRKKNRGRADLTCAALTDAFFTDHDRNEVSEPELMQKYVEKIYERLVQ